MDIQGQVFSYIDRFKGFEGAPHVAVALSGGADSLALTLILKEWVKSRKGTLTALTVNHGLRPEANDEVATIKNWMLGHRISHVILNWEGEKPTSRIQDRARQARYRLLEAWCEDNHVLHLFVGHHKNDQVETFLSRLTKGSGLNGLASMSALTEKKHVRILRPLLFVSKEELVSYLKSKNQPWIEDPTNKDRAYERTRWRSYLEENRRQEEYQAWIERFQRFRVLWDRLTACLLKDVMMIRADSSVMMSHSDVMNMSPQLIEILITPILRTVGKQDYAPKRKKRERLARALKDSNFKAATLGGCIIQQKKGALMISPERGVRSCAVLSLPEHLQHGRVKTASINLFKGKTENNEESLLKYPLTGSFFTFI